MIIPPTKGEPKVSIAEANVRQNLHEVVGKAWDAFGRAGNLPSRVSPAVPILFFGDLRAYCASVTRILTVGKNPSKEEFPEKSRFLRFRLAENVAADEPDAYLDALCAYFRADSQPYRRWFNSYEPFLNAVGASYYGAKHSTALHTDICSIVATDPTWRRLDPSQRRALERDGVPLWHDLLNVLKPQVVVISVAKGHLDKIKFRPLSDWETVHIFDRTKDGSRRQTPVKVQGRRYEISGEPSLFVFVRAAEMPMGLLGDRQKHESGTVVCHLLCSGSSPGVEIP